MLIIKTNEEHPFECFELTQRGTPRMNPFKISFTNYQRNKIVLRCQHIAKEAQRDGWEEDDLLRRHTCNNTLQNLILKEETK